ncbi:MAG: DsbA family oxidoreductase [Rhodospirillales bacterium]|nr:DsbA family oxidoreductase [Rhodospirillales bacterium]
MIIDIVSDAICPWCFIGKRRLERALLQAPQPDLRIGWRPFQLNPDMPAEGMDRKEYLRLKFGDRAGGRMYEAVEAAGREEGISFAFDRIPRTPNTILAHRLIRYAGRTERQDEIVEALFRAYFLEGMDIGRIETLASLCGALGMDTDEVERYLASEEDLADVKAEDAFARQIGVSGVPCFIIERKFAISGAQPPEAFLQAFERIRQEAAENSATA